MKSHCIKGHVYDDTTIVFRRDGSFCCRICRQERNRYYAARKNGEEVDKPRWFARERILDLLWIDGGWLTVPGIAMRLGLAEDTVNKALYRLRGKGLVRDRVVELAAAGTLQRQPESRREWSRITSQSVISTSYGEF